MHSTRPHHQANDGKSGLEAERVRGLQAMHSLQSNEELAAWKRQETCLMSNEEKEKWIKDYVDSETTVARKRVEYAETAI